MRSLAAPTRIKVHGYHLDLYGHVNNARYLEFLEAARWDVLSPHLDLEAWHDRGWLFVVVRIDISYRRAVGLGAILEVETRLARIGRTSATMRQAIRHVERADLVAEADVTFVVLDEARNRPLRLEGELRESLERVPLRRATQARDDGSSIADS
jgi:thioesterase-3